MIFYFSGTGNSAWVARQIAKAQQEELLAIAEEINKNKEYALKEAQFENLGELVKNTIFVA